MILDSELPERVRTRRTFGARLLRTTPAGAAFWGAVAILVVSNVLLARIVGRYGAFIGDDLVAFWSARMSPLLRFLLAPIDVHFVPMHRLVTFVVYRLSAVDFRWGLGVLLLFHAATVFVLFRLVRDVTDRAVAAILLCVYGLNPALGSLLMWWTSGIHRLGCVAFVALALYGYVKYRGSPNARWLAVTTLASATALGFYAKAVLVPVYIALVELNLVFVLGRRFQPRKLAASLGATLATVGLYVVGWLLATETQNHAIVFDPKVLWIFLKVGFHFFGPLAFGSWSPQAPSTALPSAGMWLLLVLVTSVASRRALVAWASLVVGVALNFVLHALAGAKTRLFGASVLISDRYYFELAFLLVVFGAFAVEAGRERYERWLSSRRARFAFAAAVLCALIALAVRSKATFKGVRRLAYVDSKAGALYMSNLRRSLAELPPRARSPISLVDSPVTRSLVPFGDIMNVNSQLLTLMGERVRVEQGGAYRVDEEGHILPCSPHADGQD